MADYEAAKRYAQAAFAIAAESGTIARWRTDLDDIAQVLTDSPLAERLADDRLPVDRRQGLLDRVLDIQPLALNLAKLLIAKNRTPDARAVADAFDVMADAHEGIVSAIVTTAVPLEPGQVATIQGQLATSLGKQVRMTTAVDPSLVGGVVVRVGDRLIDGSVRTRLRILRRELSEAR
jgi:F-type H+-transporting ATPase subunit delta